MVSSNYLTLLWCCESSHGQYRQARPILFQAWRETSQNEPASLAKRVCFKVVSGGHGEECKYVLVRGPVSPAGSPQPLLNSPWPPKRLHSSKGGNLTWGVPVPHLHINHLDPGNLISIPTLPQGPKWELVTSRLYNSAPLRLLPNVVVQISPWIWLLSHNPNCLENTCLTFWSVLPQLTFVGLVGRIRATGTYPRTTRPPPPRGYLWENTVLQVFPVVRSPGSLRWVVLIRTSCLSVEVQIRLWAKWWVLSLLSGEEEFTLGFQVERNLLSRHQDWSLRMFPGEHSTCFLSGGHILIQFKIFLNHRELFPLE